MTVVVPLAIPLLLSLADTPPVPAAAPPHQADAPVLEEIEGTELARRLRGSGQPAMLVNVWATWCHPCREEFPDLMRLHREYRGRGLRLVLVSADFRDDLPAARQFLAAHGVDFPSYLKTGDDMEFIDALEPRWSGALPATFLYDAEGNLRFFREGKTSYAELEPQLQTLLPRARDLRVPDEESNDGS